jgi:hypothetical protein
MMLTTLLLAAAAQASDNTARDVAVVGFGTAGFEVAGLIGGGLAGMAVGSTMCGDGFECWAPVIFGASGAVVGAGAGAYTGAALLPRAVGRRSGIPLVTATAGLCLGVTVLAVAGATDSGALAVVGGATVAVAIPVGAAIGTAQAPSRLIGVLPMTGGPTGVRIAGRF